ncbi:MAG: Hpt domain-containing protein [Gammaproteobacteria bacterium]|nr:Hpt domain-containing protein [Gammaproteobacteria bacterium]
MTKVLDIEQSITAANGNAKLAKDLFVMLLDDLNSRLNQIESSFKSNDLESLAEHIHKLYGATAYCIVPRLRNSVEVLDHVLKEKNQPQLNELVENVTNEIKQLIQEGQSYTKKVW